MNRGINGVLLLSVLYVLLINGCTTYRTSNKASHFAHHELQQQSTQDTTRLEVPQDYIKKHQRIHGTILGAVGFAILSYPAYKFSGEVGLRSDCFEPCNPAFFWIGGAIGALAGYKTGSYIGKKVAYKRYHAKRKKQRSSSNESP